jgi:hypothetical protein
MGRSCSCSVSRIQIVASFGKTEILKAFESDLRARLKYCSFALRPPNKTSLKFRYDYPIYAELAWRGAQRYRIEINIGLVTALVLGAFALVDDSSGCLGEMAIEDRDRLRPHQLEFMKMWEPLLRAYRLSPFRDYLPKTDWQIALAHTIAARSLDFILYHEFSHLARGHISFLLGRTKQTEGARGETRIPPRLEQLIESRADDGAAYWLSLKWRKLITEHDFLASPFVLGTGGYTFFHPEHAFKALLCSTALVFLVIEAFSRERDDDKNDQTELWPTRRYPPASYRLWRSVGLSKFDALAKLPWSSCLDQIVQSLTAHGLEESRLRTSYNSQEDNFRKYDGTLSAHDAEVYPFEQAWAAANIDPLKPPPKFPRRIWRWRFTNSDGFVR